MGLRGTDIATTVSAVGSILTAVLVGAFSAEFVPNRRTTLKDFSLLISSILVPCLLFEHLAIAFTPEAMSATVVLPLASIGGCALGLGVGMVSSNFLFTTPEESEQFRPLVLLCCAFQNTVVVPLSLLTSVYHSGLVDWFTSEQYQKCVAYCFIYTIPVVVLFWSVGAIVAGSGARKGRSDAAGKATSSVTFRDLIYSLWNPPFVASIFGMVFGLNPWLVAWFQQGPASIVWDAISIVGKGAIPCALVLLGGNLASAGLPTNTPKLAPQPTPKSSPRTTRPERSDCQVAGTQCLTLTPNNGPSAVSNTSIASSTTCIDAMMSGGGDPDPMSPLELPSTATASADRQNKNGPRESAFSSISVERRTGTSSSSTTQPSEPSSALTKVWNGVRQRLELLFAPNGIPLKILLLVPLVRLIAVPFVAVIILHFVVRPAGLVPNGDDAKVMWLVLLTEFTAPSAINTTVLCTLHGYMPGTASKMIFYQYSMCIVTMVGWLLFSLWYIGNMV